ncbi:MAG: glycosyltransferase family 4 protein [Acidimicrobiales bacterium]
MDRPLRVALDATSLYDLRSGVGRFTEEVLEGAGRRADVDPVAYAVTWRGAGRLETLLPTGVRAAPRRRMAALPLRQAWARSDRPRIEWWTGPVDVVHGTNFVVPPTRGAAVVTIHDLTYLRFPEMCTSDVLQYVDLVPRALRRGATVHAVSEFVREEVLQHYGLPADRVVAVANGITPTLVGDPARGRQAAGGERYVLAIGTVEPRKDLPGLVRAFDEVAGEDEDLRLVIAGADGWGAEALTDAITDAHHAARIRRVGWIDEPARADLLAGATALVLASRYEGFGLTAGEAMAAGVPVVATAVGGIPEVVGDAAVLVPPGDVASLAGAVAGLVSDAEQRARLVEQGRARAETFTWTRTIDGLVALWRSVVAGDR